MNDLGSAVAAKSGETGRLTLTSRRRPDAKVFDRLEADVVDKVLIRADPTNSAGSSYGPERSNPGIGCVRCRASLERSIIANRCDCCGRVSFVVPLT
jgi:hypothetical protein